MIAAVGVARLVAADAENDATRIGRIARESDSFIIDFDLPPKGVSVRFSDADWSKRLAAALEAGAFAPSIRCLCVSYPVIHFLRKNDIVLTITVHHVERLRVKDARRVNHEFFIGRAAGQAILDLARERQTANKAPEPTP